MISTATISNTVIIIDTLKIILNNHIFTSVDKIVFKMLSKALTNKNVFKQISNDLFRRCTLAISCIPSFPE